EKVAPALPAPASPDCVCGARATHWLSGRNLCHTCAAAMPAAPAEASPTPPEVEGSVEVSPTPPEVEGSVDGPGEGSVEVSPTPSSPAPSAPPTPPKPAPKGRRKGPQKTKAA